MDVVNSIKIFVKDVSPKGLNLESQLSPDFIGLTKDDYLSFIKPIDLKIKVERVDNFILSHIEAVSRFTTECARSFEKLERDWKETFTLDFEVDSTTEFIEMAEDIRQEVLMRIPLRVLSDAEMKKEQAENVKVKEVEPDSKAKMHLPFENLKDLDN